MKGSTLHRSGLTREKMGVLATFSQNLKKQSAKSQLNQYYKAQKAQEIDLLWGGVQKGIQKVHNATKGVSQKSPMVYLMIGFIAGIIFMSCITLIVSISAMAPKTVSNIENKETSVAVIGEDATANQAAPVASQEKYVVKSGDTLNGIAYRFYGKYNEAKIQEIQRINEISNPASLRVGQELIIPVER
ncbi:MAG: LysM peptidoglycan-binding domain-containing protein [Candidatus Gastranaerophilales bacterium]|nr:LysM peptidoglycan-binding domain-containing protein [Candidatus Gastranaerophilales bacterium]